MQNRAHKEKWKVITASILGLAAAFFLLQNFLDNFLDYVPAKEAKIIAENENSSSQHMEETREILPPEELIEEYLIKKNQTVYTVLRTAQVEASEIIKMVQIAKPSFNLAEIQSGIKVRVFRYSGSQEVFKVSFLLSITKTLILEKSQDQWHAKLDIKPVSKKLISFAGKVKSSLWQSAVNAGLEAQAIYLLSDIFAWQIDFEREIRPGDSWMMLIERTFVEEEEYGWGNILIAEYQRGIDSYRAIRYPQTDAGEYYSPEGDNLKGKFLKSPLRYSRISSRFQTKRFHPVLGINRPHYGVDYAAPRGTPVRAVGDGVIRSIGRRGGNGKMIRIRHNSTYETAYKHLNGYAKGLRRGHKVTQGQLIGYVGATGLATGPHLHFEFYENGRYTDPLGRKFPREDPVPPKDMEKFKLIVFAVEKQLSEKLAKAEKNSPKVFLESISKDYFKRQRARILKQEG